MSENRNATGQASYIHRSRYMLSVLIQVGFVSFPLLTCELFSAADMFVNWI